MTNEEAIEILQGMNKILCHSCSCESMDCIEAKLVAISALKSIDRITKERDALLKDLKAASDCHSCVHNKKENLDGLCTECFLGTSKWEWRGAQK